MADQWQVYPPVMADTNIIEITAEPRTSFKVKLVGVMYDIFPPKDAFTLELASKADDLAQARAAHDLVYEWIDQAFGTQAAKVRDRLHSAKDDLDIKHIIQLLQIVVERTTGNPTS